MRKPYGSEETRLLEDSLPTANPFKLFHIWFEEVKNCPEIYEPNAVCLATSDKYSNYCQIIAIKLISNTIIYLNK